jgi:hypothetical protein
LRLLDAIPQQAGGKQLIADACAQAAPNSLPFQTSGKRLLKVFDPAYDGASGYSEHPDKLTGAQAVGHSLAESYHNQQHSPPVDTPAHKQAGVRHASFPTAFPTTA